MDFSVLVVSLITAMLINNVLLMQFLGICPFLGVSKRINAALGMSAAVAFVMLLAVLITYPLYFYVLEPLKIAYLDTIAFILVIASLVQFVEMVIKKFSAGLYKSLGVYLPLITTNCAILGVAQGNISQAVNYLDAIFITVGTAAGFALVIFAFSAIRTRLDSANVSASFKGVPVALVTAGLMSLAFMGLSGLI